MNTNFILLPEAVDVVAAASKVAILDAVANKFAAAYGVDAVQTLEALEEREALGSTGFGHGAAIPHARVFTVRRPVSVLLKLKTPVDFGSADGVDVNFVFGLLSPVNAGVSHLHALAAISRLVRDEIFHDALTSAQEPDSLYSLITNAVDRDAA